jgi:hypothetical protein
MVRKIKFGKIAIVIFLTILIWVWTDLYLDDELFIPRATISVAHSRELLVSFSGQSEAVVNNIKLEGPATKIADLRRQLADGTFELDFTLNPELEGMISTGSRTLNVLDFLKRSDKIKEKELSGLTIEGCEPEIIDVNIVKLVKRPLEIECFNENGIPVTVESISPEKVDMFVPENSRLKAQVRLTNSEINKARLSQAIIYPYVELITGQQRLASQQVRIKMPPEADSLTEYTIQDATLGFALSMNLVGEYKIEVNYTEVVNPFFILATPEAKEAYERQHYQMTLYILDDDADAKEPNKVHRREVVYNFPPEYVRKDEIRLKNPEQPAVAEFKLISLKSAETSASGSN